MLNTQRLNQVLGQESAESLSELSEKGDLNRPVYLTVAWLGQMAASMFWMISVFVDGISSLGGVIQLLAAFSWFIANLASLREIKS